MKKFSELSNNTDNVVESATNKQDFIKNLVEESLTVIEGEIIGKDVLVKTLNKIIEMNDSKTKIEVLESVRVQSYRGGFDFKLISEAIETEKYKINNPVVEEAVEEAVEEELEMIQESVETEEVIEEEVIEEEVIEESAETEEETEEEIIEEAKKDKCDVCKECGEKCDDCKCEKCDCDDDKVDESVETEESEEEEVIEETVEEEIIEESNEDSAVEEVDYITSDYMREKSDLTSLYENILNEDHLNTKKEKVEYVLANSDLDKDSGLKKKEELENMSDKELDAAYKKCEIDCNK